MADVALPCVPSRRQSNLRRARAYELPGAGEELRREPPPGEAFPRRGRRDRRMGQESSASCGVAACGGRRRAGAVRRVCRRLADASLRTASRRPLACRRRRPRLGDIRLAVPPPHVGEPREVRRRRLLWQSAAWRGRHPPVRRAAGGVRQVQGAFLPRAQRNGRCAVRKAPRLRPAGRSPSSRGEPS